MVARALLALLAVLPVATAGCKACDANLPPDTADLAVAPDLAERPDARAPTDLARDLATPRTDGGSCATLPGRIPCADDTFCSDSLESCQHGVCCSGVLDPKTCRCDCNGEECSRSSRCCTDPWDPLEPARDLGPRKCRFAELCWRRPPG